MGLVKCPDCGKMVSNRVTACPNCGCPSEFFEEAEQETQVENVSEISEKREEPKQTKGTTRERLEETTLVKCGDIQFKFGKLIISYPQSTKNIAKIYGKYVKLSRDYCSKYVDLYQSAGDMYTVLTTLTDQVIADIASLEDMAAKDLYDFGIRITRKDFDEDYVLGFKKEIESLYDQYASIEQEKDDLAYQRQVEKASRGRWQGGGFGMKGAIKGAMNAAVLNAGSDLFHSIGDGFAKSGDRKYINNKFEAIYVSESNRDCFVISAFYCFESIIEGIKTEMANYGLIDTDIFGDYDDISSMYETTMKYEKATQKKFENMVNCFKSSPEEKKYYEAILPELFQQGCELEEFLRFWNLEWIYTELQKNFSAKLFRNINNPFVTNLCSFGAKMSGKTEETADGLLIYGQVLKGQVSIGDEIIITKNIATPLIKASVVKITCDEREVNKTNLGGNFGFVLNIKNKDSISEGEMFVNSSSFNQPESNLYANYESDGKRIVFDFSKKYESINAAWYTFVVEDKYVSNRGITFSSSFDEIVKTYGKTVEIPFTKESDELIEAAKDSSDIKRLEDAKDYIEYIFGKTYAIRFYFNEKQKLILVAYLKNIGLTKEKVNSNTANGFDMRIECMNCGKLIGSDRKFCNFCGEPSPLYMKRCPSCGKTIKKDIKFCNFCGYDFEL